MFRRFLGLGVNSLKGLNYLRRQNCVNQRAQQEKNKLKFIYITSAGGGLILGYSIRAYYDEIYVRKQEQLQPSTNSEQKVAIVQEPANNMLNFSATWNSNWDNLAPAPGEPLKKGTRYITLVRHGQYVVDVPKEEKKLTDLGREQAELCGKRLKQLHKKFDAIYVSELRRSQESGEIIAKYFPTSQYIKDGLLSEGFPAPVSPGSEKWNEKWAREKDIDGVRISKAFEKYIKRADSDEDSHELFVIHGNVIRYFLCRALQFPVEGWLRFAVYNTGITQIEIKPNGNVSVRGVGDVGHLEKNQITYH